MHTPELKEGVGGGAEAQQARQPRGKKAGVGAKAVKRSAVAPEPFAAAPAARPLFSSVARGGSGSKILLEGGGGDVSRTTNVTARSTRKLTPVEKDLKLQSFKSYTFD